MTILKAEKRQSQDLNEVVRAIYERIQIVNLGFQKALLPTDLKIQEIRKAKEKNQKVEGTSKV